MQLADELFKSLRVDPATIKDHQRLLVSIFKDGIVMYQVLPKDVPSFQLNYREK